MPEYQTTTFAQVWRDSTEPGGLWQLGYFCMGCGEGHFGVWLKKYAFNSRTCEKCGTESHVYHGDYRPRRPDLKLVKTEADSP